MAFCRNAYGIVLDKGKYRTNATKIENVEVWENGGGVLINNGFNNVLRGAWVENNLGKYCDVEIRDSFGCGIVESYVERNREGEPLIRIVGSVASFIHRNIITDSKAGAIVYEDESSSMTTLEGNRIKGVGEYLILNHRIGDSNLLLRK